MDLQINPAKPSVMHVDLNACFAMLEQQANPLIRNKPVVVAAYASDNGCVLSPSYEAKKFGIKVGMRVFEAKKLCCNVIVLKPDPPKYRDAHIRFRKIFEDYTPDVYPKSIDEAILDFKHMKNQNFDLIKIGYDIKHRMKIEIGEWVTCNVGISTNRFLAKLAASLHKPNGLDVITKDNLLDTFRSIELLDLYGINTRYQARLNSVGIFTVMELFKTSEFALRKQAFRSINGYYWYLRLRGWEIDSVEFGRKSYGHSYSLQKKTDNPQELARLFMKLCEKMGRRLRRAQCCAYGIHVSCLNEDKTYWHKSKRFTSKMYTTLDLYRKVLYLFNQRPDKKVVKHLAVSCFDLHENNISQLTLFDDANLKELQISKAADAINDKHGEFTITPALMMGMKEKTILDRIAFGNVKDLHENITRAY